MNKIYTIISCREECYKDWIKGLRDCYCKGVREDPLMGYYQRKTDKQTNRKERTVLKWEGRGFQVEGWNVQ